MASLTELQGSFGSLSDTLAFRFDPGFPPDLASRWLGVLGVMATIGHRKTAWDALPDQSPSFDPVIAQLAGATHAIVVASTIAARTAALDLAQTALTALDALLGPA